MSATVTSYMSGGSRWPSTAPVRRHGAYAIDMGATRDEAEKNAIARARGMKCDLDENGGRAEQVREVEL